MLIFVAIGILLIFIVKYMLKCRRLPPGPYGIPLVGYYPFLGKIPAESIAELSQKYGDVMTVNLLGDNYWFLNSIEAIEEAFVKNGNLFNGRAYSREWNTYSLLSTNCSGVLEGDDWRLNHRITVGNLSLLGIGKSEFENTIHDILDTVEDYVDSKAEIANDYYEILANFASNTIMTLTMSKRFEYNDPQYIRIRDWVHDMSTSYQYMNFMLSGIGFKILMKIKPKCVKTIEKCGTQFRKYIDSLIDERMDTYDLNSCSDLLDCYLKEKDGPNGHLFHRRAISAKIMELIFGGTHTTAAILYHSLNLMSSNPQIQRKVHEEINDVCGTEGIVSYSDRHRLPYTRAVISEIHRYVCLVAFITTHSNRETTKFRGFEMPKREKIIANFYAVSRNPKYFVNPHEFDPRNFLDANGFYISKKELIPFGIGPRQCVGATLAKVDMFLAFTRLMQRFQWQPFRDDNDKTVQEGLLRHLSRNKILAIRRQN